MKVDPFIAPIPKKILNDQELRPFFEYFVRWAHDLWIRTGGGDDAITSTQNRDLYDSTAFAGFAATLDDIDQDISLIKPEDHHDHSVSIFENTEYQDNSVSVCLLNGSYFQSISTNLTTSGNQTLVCTAALTVTLNDKPQDGETVRVKSTNGDVTISGNGKNIDGESTYTIVVNYECINCVYSVLDDEWFIV